MERPVNRTSILLLVYYFHCCYSIPLAMAALEIYRYAMAVAPRSERVAVLGPK